MAMDINQINVRYWETLVLITIKSFPPMTVFVIQQQNNSIVQHAVDEIILPENKKLSVKDETHENIDDEFDEDEMCDIDKMSLDEK